MFIRHISGFVAASVLGLLVAGPVLAQRERGDRKGNPSFLGAFHEVVAGPSNSTVRILCKKGDKDEEVAYGAIVGADGWIVTKASELKDRPVMCRLKDGRELTAKVVGVENRTDLALLKVDAKNLKPVVWGDSKTAVPGNWLAVPGLNSEPVAVGVVSVAARKVTARDMPIVNGGYLGIGLGSAGKESGAKITEVTRDSAAAKAGLKENDIVIGLDGKAITDPDALITAVTSLKPGVTVTLRVKRDEKEIELKATLAKRKGGERSDFQNTLGGKLSERRGGFPMILQHDTVLAPNECGGPLIDLDGKTVGINIARAGRVETYAIPAESVVALLPDMKAGKYPPPVKVPVKAESEEVRKVRERLKKAESELNDAEKKSGEMRKNVEQLRKDLQELEKSGKDEKK